MNELMKDMWSSVGDLIGVNSCKERTKMQEVIGTGNDLSMITYFMLSNCLQ